MAQLRASQNQLSSTIAAASRGGSRRSCDGMIGIAHDPRFYLFLGRVRDGERKERRKRREERRVVLDAVIFLPAFYSSVVSREFFAPFRLSPPGREGFYDLLMETGFNRRL